MGAATQLDLFCSVRPEPRGRSDSAGDAQATVASAAEREMSEEFDAMSIDLGAADLPEDFGDWKDDYADAVGISRWREL